MKVITEKLLNNEQFKNYINEAQNETSPIFLLGLTDFAKSYITGTTLKLLNKPLLIIGFIQSSCC